MQVNGNGFLGRVELRASCALSASIGAVWAVVREWGCCSWLQEIDGQPLRCSLVEGGSNTSVGAVRMVEVGAQRMFEKLIALDEDEHSMKWQVISHQDTINPFQASLVNYICTLKLMPITVGDNAFIDWRGELFTEVQHTVSMKATLERWYLTGFQCLQETIAHGNFRPSQKHYGTQMGSLQSSPFVVTSTSPKSAAVGIMGPGTSATASMYVSAPPALPRSLSSGRSMESIMSGHELLSPQKLGGQMSRQQDEATEMLCAEQALGRNKNASVDSDVLMGRSVSVQLPLSRLQLLERGSSFSLPLSAEQPAPPRSNSNSGSASGERELDGDTLNSLIAGGRSGTLSRAELRAQLSGLYTGPVTREEIQLLVMLRDARTPAAAAPISSGDGSGASPGTADMSMARTASVETAAGSSLNGDNPGSRRSSEEFLYGSKNMLLESHPLLAHIGRDAPGKFRVPSPTAVQGAQAPEAVGLTREGSDTNSTSSVSALPACMACDVWHSEPVRR